MRTALLLGLLGMGTLWAGVCHGQVIDATARAETVAAIAQTLVDRYTFPEVGEKMAALLRQKLAAGDYDALTNGSTFAKQLTEDVRSISHDKHLRVRYSTNRLERGARDDKPTPAQLAAFRERERRENGGVDKAEVLPGNIGYLRLRYFGLAPVAGPRIAGAMDFLNGTDALVIDIRDNGGAIDPGTIAILCSYFFTEERVHLNSLLWRKGNREDQSWTLPLLPGPRYLDKPVYVLTSKRTFSGAEEFAYNLQTRKRALIVGATTGGGANPGGDRAVTDHFSVWVPTGRAHNPVTKTNWEGTGVKPDVEMEPARALLGVQKLALETLIPKSDADPEWQSMLRTRLGDVDKELSALPAAAN